LRTGLFWHFANPIQTQFITKDGTTTGDLTQIKRIYVQGGKVIQVGGK